jgi:hypothetical protein
MEKREHWLDEPRNVDRVFHTLCGLCALVVAADLLYDKKTYFWFEAWIGFHAAFGFVACVGLVLVAKQLRRLLLRSEDYYDR